GREYLLDTSVLKAEGLVLEGQKGRSGTNDKPWIMLRNMKNGKGIAVSLAYSGNWRLTVKLEGNDVRLKAGTLPESLKPFKNVAGMPMPGGLAVEFQGN